MKTPLFFLAFLASITLPPTVFGRWDTLGTPDEDNNGYGDLQRSYNYEYTVKPKEPLPGSGMIGTSSLQGEWWTASSSTSPWDDYVANPLSSDQPSFHITETVSGGDTLFVGLSLEYQYDAFTSSFRMANDLFVADTNFYFALRSDTEDNDILEKDANGKPKVGKTGSLNAVESLDYQGTSRWDDVAGVWKNHSDVTGSSEVSTNPPHIALQSTFNEHGFTAEKQFEWIHYHTDGPSSSDDILWVLKKGKEAALKPNLTEWLLFIEVPQSQPDIVGELWPDIIGGSTDADRLDDLVFSWTIDGKNGYTIDGVDENGDPIYHKNSLFKTPDSAIPIIPEPSSLLLVIKGIAIFFLFRRSRKSLF